jgi:hypothetical protein
MTNRRPDAFHPITFRALTLQTSSYLPSVSQASCLSWLRTVAKSFVAKQIATTKTATPLWQNKFPEINCHDLMAGSETSPTEGFP